MKTFKKILIGVAVTAIVGVSISLLYGAMPKAVENADNVHGIDISHHQKNIDWDKLADSLSDSAFVYIKCTEGGDYVDDKCLEYARAARAHGLLIGCYHYFRPKRSAKMQYENFSKLIDEVRPDLIPMIDVETSDGVSREELREKLFDLLNMLEKRYGEKPMIYGTMKSYNQYCAPTFNDYPLYIGRYSTFPPVIIGNEQYTVWQYSDEGKLQGIKCKVDLCKFNSQKNISDILLH